MTPTPETRIVNPLPRDILLFLVFLILFMPTAIPWHLVPIPGVGVVSKLGVLCLAFLVMTPSLANRRMLAGKYVATMLLLWFWLAFGLLYTPSMDYGLWKVGMFIPNVLFPLLVFHKIGLTRRDLKILAVAMLVGALLTLLNLWLSFDLANSPEQFGRSRLPNSGAIPIARALGLGFAVACSRMFFDRGKGLYSQLFSIFTALACLGGITYTGTRAGLLAATAVFLFLIFYVLFLRGWLVRGGLVLLIVIGGGFLLIKYTTIITSSPGWQRYSAQFQRLVEKNQGQNNRWDAFVLAWEGLKENPLAGLGTGGFESLDHPFLGETRVYPHNLLLEIGSENGIVGLIIVLWLLAFVGWRLLTVFLSRPEPMNGEDTTAPRRLGGRKRLLLMLKGGSEYTDKALCLAWLFMALNIQVAGDIVTNAKFWIMGYLVCLIKPGKADS